MEIEAMIPLLFGYLLALTATEVVSSSLTVPTSDNVTHSESFCSESKTSKISFDISFDAAAYLPQNLSVMVISSNPYIPHEFRAYVAEISHNKATITIQRTDKSNIGWEPMSLTMVWTRYNDTTTNNCNDVYKLGYRKSGVYSVRVDQDDGTSVYVNVYCDMQDEGGWTVFQRKSGEAVGFNRSWTDYKVGFGSFDHNFWLGEY
uniref:angiopoietin-1-like n=1 Tax=Ciona intestinalis TaxID=7719 RepID=UPI000EF4B78B|nr:angiopoietin-1-like [Ciona intestinalis]|eukprot:XP_026695125.1 angiopoietin-1-like [Ciona intestinalis]